MKPHRRHSGLFKMIICWCISLASSDRQQTKRIELLPNRIIPLKSGIVGGVVKATCCMYEMPARLCCRLSSVCRYWKAVTLRHLSSILGPLNVDLNALNLGYVIPCILWLCKHKPIIGSLSFDAQLPDVPVLIKLLRSCQTEQLLTVRAYLRDTHLAQSDYSVSQWLAAEARRLGMNVTVDWNNWGFYRETQTCAQINNLSSVLGISLNERRTEKDLHDTLAAQCSNVSDLIIRVSIPVGSSRHDWSQHISSDLFSLQSIRKIKICLGFFKRDFRTRRIDSEIDRMIFNKMTRNLSSLEHLSLAGGLDIPDCWELMRGRRFHINLRSLLSLDVTDLPSASWVSCDCPRLKTFQCSGTWYGSNGSRPVKLPLIASDEQQALTTRAGDVPYIGLDVPDSCEVIAEQFSAMPSSKAGGRSE